MSFSRDDVLKTIKKSRKGHSVPPGWKHTAQLAAEWGCSIDAVRGLMARAMAAKAVSVKKLRSADDGITRKHFFLKKT